MRRGLKIDCKILTQKLEWKLIEMKKKKYQSNAIRIEIETVCIQLLVLIYCQNLLYFIRTEAWRIDE